MPGIWCYILLLLTTVTLPLVNYTSVFQLDCGLLRSGLFLLNSEVTEPRTYEVHVYQQV